LSDVALTLLPLLLAVAAPAPTVHDIPVAPGEVVRATVSGVGPPVVLVPGLVSSAFAFRNLVPVLGANGLRVIIVEPLGVGWSSRPGQADYSLTAQAGRIATALDALGVRGAVVMGHALSVSMVFRLALLRPDLVSGIVANNGGPEEVAATSGVRKAARFAFLIRLFGGTGRLRKELEKGLRGTAGDTTWITRETLDAYAAPGVRDLGATLGVLKGLARARDDSLAPRLPAIAVPVHLLVGAAPHGSGIKPAHAALLRERLPRLVVDSIPGAGLHLHEERPDIVAGALLAMAGRV
jgi:pimeloyl-ACP methyl ester carboxylesterase